MNNASRAATMALATLLATMGVMNVILFHSPGQRPIAADAPLIVGMIAAIANFLVAALYCGLED